MQIHVLITQNIWLARNLKTKYEMLLVNLLWRCQNWHSYILKILYIHNDETKSAWTINTMILSAGLVQMLLRNPKTQIRNSQSLCEARNSSIYILTSGYIHSSGFVLSTFSKKCEKRLMQVEILKGWDEAV